MIVEVIINSNAKDLNKIFEYHVPEEIEEKIKKGSRILVPFGNMKKLEEAFVIGIKENSSFQTKDIAKIQIGEHLENTKIELAKWMAKRYFCNIADSIKLMLPPGTTTKNFSNRIKEKTASFVEIKEGQEEKIEWEIENKKIKSEKQLRVLKFLRENGQTAITDLEILTDTSRAIIKTLEKNNYIEITQKQVERNPFIHKVVTKTQKLIFTPEQQNAYNQIEEAIEDNMHSEFLIFGVTGSRKNRNLFTGN